jgi:hypothetical protein
MATTNVQTVDHWYPPTAQITTHTNVRLSVNPTSNTTQVRTTTTLPLPPSIWGIRLLRFFQCYKLLIKCHRPTIHGPNMQHDTDDRNYERNIFVRQKTVTCLLQSAPLQTWTVFPTLTKWWLIWRYSFRRRFQWTKTQFCLIFQISWRPYPANSMRRHLSWHTTFRFMNSKLVLHCIFGYTLSKYHPTNQTPMTSQMIRFVTHKYSPKIVCRNQNQGR